MSIDLKAIREDIDMASRSVEMARHVALDHGPELLAEIDRLEAINATVQDAFAEVLHTHLGDLSEWETIIDLISGKLTTERLNEEILDRAKSFAVALEQAESELADLRAANGTKGEQ